VAIVLGARESRVQGEGPQPGRRVRSNPAGCEGLGILADARRALRPIKPSQAVAVCGESRMHGDNGGDGETQVMLCALSLPTDEVYKGVIPPAQHKAITKNARKTNHTERFNNTLRQRVSRLTRDTLSFSKKLTNHIVPSDISSVTITSRERHYMDSTTRFQDLSPRRLDPPSFPMLHLS
jgi:hypothetical protein